MTDPCVVLCDLDGVIWLAHQPLPGAPEAVARLRSHGHRVVFVTNNSYATLAEQEATLAAIGIEASGELVTSAMASASLVEPSWNVLICGGAGLTQAVERQGARAVQMSEVERVTGSVDAVVVGFHRSFDYDSLRKASRAIRNGAVFIASNEDATYPTPDGPIPGGGSIVAAVATASASRPVIAGKPHRTMATLVRSLVPGVDDGTVMVGDRPSTDGRFARELGCRFALVHSDVSQDEMRSGPDSEVSDSADFQGVSLSEISEKILGIR